MNRRDFINCASFSAVLSIPGGAAGEAIASGDDVRHWREYAQGSYGQVHFFVAAPKIAIDRLRRPLVCIHPSPTTGEMYAALQIELARDRWVYCPDTPGFGSSDSPTKKPSIADYASALLQAIEHIAHDVNINGRGQIDLFGFHTGSLIAAEIAIQRPDLIHKLIISGVPHYPDPAQREQERKSHVKPYPYFQDREYVGKMFQRLVLDAKDSGSNSARLRRFGERLRAGENGWWGPDAVFLYDTNAQLPRISTPTLLIAFNEEMTEPTRQAAKIIPGANIVDMTDLPIFGFIANPVRVATTLINFFDS